MSDTTVHLAVQIRRLGEVQSELGTYFEHGTVELPIEVKEALHSYVDGIMEYISSLQNKCTYCKGVKNDTSFGQITGIQEKLDTTCK